MLPVMFMGKILVEGRCKIRVIIYQVARDLVVSCLLHRHQRVILCLGLTQIMVKGFWEHWDLKSFMSGTGLVVVITQASLFVEGSLPLT